MQSLSAPVIAQLRADTHITDFTTAVWELVANAVDAGARAISVDVDPSQGYARVEDDGSGIPHSSLLLVGSRSCTSKSTSSLAATYGTRGESLANLRLVSQLRVTSRAAQQFDTYTLTLPPIPPSSSQASPAAEPRPCPPRPQHGTTITMEGFLLQQPVRQRLQQQDPGATLSSLVHQVALAMAAQQHIDFRLTTAAGRQQLLHLPAGRTLADLCHTLCAALEEGLQCIPLLTAPASSMPTHSSDTYSIRGYITRLDAPLSHSGHQVTYLNQQLVACPQVSSFLAAWLQQHLAQQPPGAGTLMARSARKPQPGYLLLLQGPPGGVSMQRQAAGGMEVVWQDWPAACQVLVNALAPVWGRPPSGLCPPRKACQVNSSSGTHHQHNLAMSGGAAAVSWPSKQVAAEPGWLPDTTQAADLHCLLAAGSSGGGLHSLPGLLLHAAAAPPTAAAAGGSGAGSGGRWGMTLTHLGATSRTRSLGGRAAAAGGSDWRASSSGGSRAGGGSGSRSGGGGGSTKPHPCTPASPDLLQQRHHQQQQQQQQQQHTLLGQQQAEEPDTSCPPQHQLLMQSTAWNKDDMLAGDMLAGDMLDSHDQDCISLWQRQGSAQQHQQLWQSVIASPTTAAAVEGEECEGAGGVLLPAHRLHMPSRQQWELGQTSCWGWSSPGATPTQEAAQELLPLFSDPAGPAADVWLEGFDADMDELHPSSHQRHQQQQQQVGRPACDGQVVRCSTIRREPGTTTNTWQQQQPRQQQWHHQRQLDTFSDPVDHLQQQQQQRGMEEGDTWLVHHLLSDDAAALLSLQHHLHSRGLQTQQQQQQQEEEEEEDPWQQQSSKWRQQQEEEEQTWQQQPEEEQHWLQQQQQHSSHKVRRQQAQHEEQPWQQQEVQQLQSPWQRLQQGHSEEQPWQQQQQPQRRPRRLLQPSAIMEMSPLPPLDTDLPWALRQPCQQQLQGRQPQESLLAPDFTWDHHHQQQQQDVSHTPGREQRLLLGSPEPPAEILRHIGPPRRMAGSTWLHELPSRLLEEQGLPIAAAAGGAAAARRLGAAGGLPVAAMSHCSSPCSSCSSVAGADRSQAAAAAARAPTDHGGAAAAPAAATAAAAAAAAAADASALGGVNLLATTEAAVDTGDPTDGGGAPLHAKHQQQQLQDPPLLMLPPFPDRLVCSAPPLAKRPRSAAASLRQHQEEQQQQPFGGYLASSSSSRGKMMPSAAGLHQQQQQQRPEEGAAHPLPLTHSSSLARRRAVSGGALGPATRPAAAADGGLPLGRAAALLQPRPQVQLPRAGARGRDPSGGMQAAYQPMPPEAATEAGPKAGRGEPRMCGPHGPSSGCGAFRDVTNTWSPTVTPALRNPTAAVAGFRKKEQQQQRLHQYQQLGAQPPLGGKQQLGADMERQENMQGVAGALDPRQQQEEKEKQQQQQWSRVNQEVLVTCSSQPPAQGLAEQQQALHHTPTQQEQHHQGPVCSLLAEDGELDVAALQQLVCCTAAAPARPVGGQPKGVEEGVLPQQQQQQQQEQTHKRQGPQEVDDHQPVPQQQQQQQGSIGSAQGQITSPAAAGGCILSPNSNISASSSGAAACVAIPGTAASGAMGGAGEARRGAGSSKQPLAPPSPAAGPGSSKGTPAPPGPAAGPGSVGWERGSHPRRGSGGLKRKQTAAAQAGDGCERRSGGSRGRKQVRFADLAEAAAGEGPDAGRLVMPPPTAAAATAAETGAAGAAAGGVAWVKGADGKAHNPQEQQQQQREAEPHHHQQEQQQVCRPRPLQPAPEAPGATTAATAAPALPAASADGTTHAAVASSSGRRWVKQEPPILSLDELLSQQQMLPARGGGSGGSSSSSKGRRDSRDVVGNQQQGLGGTPGGPVARGVLEEGHLVTQVASKLLLVRHGSRLWLVDQHAADERVQLEALQSQMAAELGRRQGLEGEEEQQQQLQPQQQQQQGQGQKQPVAQHQERQRLLQSVVPDKPLAVQLTALEAAAATRYHQQLSRWGWQLHPASRPALGATTPHATSSSGPLPPACAAAGFVSQGASSRGCDGDGGSAGVALGGCFQLAKVPRVVGVLLTGVDLQMYLHQLMETGVASTPPPGVLRVLRSKACRTAIMFGQVLSQEQGQALLQQLSGTQLYWCCAHGRPTTVPLVDLQQVQEGREAARKRAQTG